jgi:hypothetical protein
MAWDTKKGFYVSTVVLDAPWEEEVTGVETRVGEHINPTTISRRGFDDKITYNNFKSLDGSPWTKPARKDRGEMPDDFVWTPTYYDNPVLRAVIDWFPVKKTRVRLARTKAGATIGAHFDWDNRRLGFPDDKELLRIWVAMDDGNACWYRLTNGVCDANISLKRGQFLILNTDTVIHQTETCDNDRSNLIIHVESNQWIKCLPDIFPRHCVRNPVTEPDPQ